jgi:hypothetical protein
LATIPLYFFLNKVLHKKLSIIRAQNILVAWNYPDESRVWYDYSQVKKGYQYAYKINEVAELVGRSPNSIRTYWNNGLIQHPSGQVYKIHNRKPSVFYWSEDDVLDLRDQIYEILPKNRYGEPFKYKGNDLISKAELKAKMRGDTSYYVKSESGEYVKVWKAL